MHPLQLGKWIALFALLSTVGCASYPHVYCAPEDCGPCGPQACATPCTDCGGSDCKVACGKPARGLFTHIASMATCGGGCGQFYIHPWINERPAKCDPCENHGNWTGPGDCCEQGFWNSFWGNKPCGTGCDTCTKTTNCGCDSCGGGYSPAYDGPAYDGPAYEEESSTEPSIMIHPAPASHQQPVARAPQRPASKATGTGVR